MPNDKRPPVRKIHINLPEDVHQRLRVKCALEDVTIQEYVAALIGETVGDIPVPEKSNARGRR